MNDLVERFMRERRLARRHIVKTRLRIRHWKSDVPEQRAESMNLSERGIYFATNWLLRDGETVEILFKMPEDVTGEPTCEWRCTGHVVRVEPVDSPYGKMGVGVQFDCYEVSRVQQLERPEERPLSRRLATRVIEL